MANLLCLTFVFNSTAAMEIEELEAFVLEIGLVARQYDITGALLHDDGNFIVCVEGPASGVREIRSRFQAETRTSGLVELTDERVESRSFPDWGVGITQPMHSELLSWSTERWKRFGAALDRSTPCPSAVDLLVRFWAQGSGQRT
jgi:hypothetical protein